MEVILGDSDRYMVFKRSVRLVEFFKVLWLLFLFVFKGCFVFDWFLLCFLFINIIFCVCF